MASADKISCVTLPSIEEFYPEHLLQLPSAKRPFHPPPNASSASKVGHNMDDNHIPSLRAVPMTPFRYGPPKSPDLILAGERFRFPPFGDSGFFSHSPSTSPMARPGALPRSPNVPSFPFAQRRSTREHEKKHACGVCGRAFNRPSSLAIHENTHTGAQPYECPFPGCGRRFNVNSNMRRHFRNHTSPSRQMATSPYTYPLTTVPRALPTAHRGPGQVVEQGSRPRAWTVAGSSSSAYTDSSDEDELSQESSFQPTFDHSLDAKIRQTTERMDHLRLRSHSSPGLRPTRALHRDPFLSPPAPACTVSGCHCTIAGRPRSD